AEELEITISKKELDGMTVDELRRQKFMYGISIKSISRGGVNIPVLAKMKIRRGDVVTVVGLVREVNAAAPRLGYADRKSTKTDLVFVG
ncbi:aspartate-alanine antiporter, partial [Klebsiella oxytoca]